MTDLAPSSLGSGSVTSSSSASISSSSSSAIPQPSSASKPWRTKSLSSSKHTATSTTSMLSAKQDSPAMTTITTTTAAGTTTITAHANTNGASKQTPSVEAPAKAATQKSMLEKLKLFNSKGGSKSSAPVQQPTQGDSGSGGGALRDSGIVVDRVESGSNTDLLEESEGNARPVNGSSGAPPVTVTVTTSSPKIALKGIAQRTFSRALTAKKSSVKGAEKEKEKERAKDKDKERVKESSKRTSVPERGETRDGEPREENGSGGGATEVEPKRTSKIASLIPKGGKAAASKKEGSTSTHSGIPKPGSKASGVGAGQGKGSAAPPGGKDGERPRSMRLGGSLALHRDSRHSSSSSSLASTEGKGQQSHSAALVANPSATQSTASNTVSVQLPQPQQQYSHPNTATVAPFMYR